MTRSLLALLCLAGLVGCTDDPPAVRSCRGERVLECDPYEWAIATSASLTPPAVPLADPRVRPTITVDLTTCGASTPSAPTVQIVAIYPSDTDGGAPRRVVNLATVSASSATDTHIEVAIDNPFDLSNLPDSDVILRFTPVIGGCDGEPVEIPYHTGPVVTP